MSATESLASVDTICVDKTGTLTDGNLTLIGIAGVLGDVVRLAHRQGARVMVSGAPGGGDGVHFNVEGSAWFAETYGADVLERGGLGG